MFIGPVETFMFLLGAAGSLFGIYSLILQLRDRNRVDPRIQSIDVRIIPPNFNYLIQATLTNLGSRVAENCTAQIFENGNPLTVLSHMPIDSPAGKIGPDWPSYSHFSIFPRTPIVIRGYLNSDLSDHIVRIRLSQGETVRDESNHFTLPHPSAFSIPVEHPADTVVEPPADTVVEPPADTMVEPPADVFLVDPPESSYPNDIWEFIWFRYTQDKTNPWGDIIGKASVSELNFDFDWGEGIVSKSGLSNNVGFVASRTIRITDAGEHTFLIGGDDGIRLQVQNENLTTVLSINEWNDQTYSQFQKTIGLPGGEYKLLLEWYEHYSDAHVSFDMRPNKFNVNWYLSGDVMRVPPYGSMDIPSSDSASKLTVQQFEDEGNVKIICDMKLQPVTIYRLAIGKWYSRGSDRHPGLFFNTMPRPSFITDANGYAIKEIIFKPKDFPIPGLHTLSMWLNNVEPQRTVLISDNFEVRVRKPT